MFYHCALHAPDHRRPQALARAARRTARKSRNLTIDIHCHFMSPRAIEFVRPHGGVAAESAMRFATIGAIIMTPGVPLSQPASAARLGVRM